MDIFVPAVVFGRDAEYGNRNGQAVGQKDGHNRSDNQEKRPLGRKAELRTAVGDGFKAEEHPRCHHHNAENLPEGRAANIRVKSGIEAGMLGTHGQHPAKEQEDAAQHDER